VAERGVQFTRAAAKRIADAVRAEEHRRRGGGGHRRRFVTVTDEQVIQVQIMGNSTGGGKYTGYIWLPPTNVFSLDTNVSEADFGTQGPECYIWNRQEIAGGGHFLTHEDNTGQRLYSGTVIRVASDGKPVIGVNASWDEACE
jgi:hypothetical protein